MSEKIDKSTLTSALPESLKNDEGVRVVCAGVDPQTQALGAVAMREPWISMVGNERVQNLSSNELDHIAYMLGSHVWIADWTVEQKRAYVSRIIPLKRVAGTAYAIQNAFAQLGYIAQVADAQTSPTMVPGTFTVYLVDQPVPSDEQWTLFWIVDQIKPASRPWRWESRTNASTDAEVYSAARPVVWVNIDAEITVSTTLPALLGRFEADGGEGDAIYSINTGETSANGWALGNVSMREYIEPTIGEIVHDVAKTVRGYSRSAAYQTNTTKLDSGASGYIYPEGELTSVDAPDDVSGYVLQGIYGESGNTLSMDGISLISSGGKLKLNNGSTASIVWLYIEYMEG